MRLSRWISAAMQRRSLRRWRRIARTAETRGPGALRTLRKQARELRRQLDRVLFVAEERLSLPAIGSNAIPKPLNTDWAYRPELWRGPVRPRGLAAAGNGVEYGAEVKLFHDCVHSELALRQMRNSLESDLAAFGLRIEVFHFDGSFLSLVVELPQSGVQGLERRHVIQMNTVVHAERPLEIFARLNVKHGPNVEQIVRELPLGAEDVVVEFDLAYTKLNEKRVDSMWLDLIFEGAEMNRILLRDLTLTRRPRAEI